jgi:glutaredoxin
MRKVEVISKPGCHLCEIVQEALTSISSRYDLDLHVLNILQDRKLHDEYWLRIPVVLIDGREVLDARDMDQPGECLRKLETLLGPE